MENPYTPDHLATLKGALVACVYDYHGSGGTHLVIRLRQLEEDVNYVVPPLLTMQRICQSADGMAALREAFTDDWTVELIRTPYRSEAALQLTHKDHQEPEPLRRDRDPGDEIPPQPGENPNPDLPDLEF